MSALLRVHGVCMQALKVSRQGGSGSKMDQLECVLMQRPLAKDAGLE